MVAHVSRISAAPYPPGARGSAPGVATTIRAPGATSSRIRSPDDEITGCGRNIRPRSSAVRSEPMITGRIRVPPHSWQRCRTSMRPHQRQVGGAASSCPAFAWPGPLLCDGPWGISRGPLQWRHRAGVPQRAQDSVGT